MPSKHRWKQRLHKRDDNATLRLRTFGVRIDAVVVTKSDMHQATFVSAHRRQAHRAVLANGTRGSRMSHGDNLVMSTALIAFDIDSNRITESKLAAYQQREDRLERLERTPMTTDQHGEVGSGDIEDKLPLIPLVLIDGRLTGIEEGQQVAKDRNGNIGDCVELLVGLLLASLVAFGNRSIFPSRRFLDLLNLVRHGTLH